MDKAKEIESKANLVQNRKCLMIVGLKKLLIATTKEIKILVLYAENHAIIHLTTK